MEIKEKIYKKVKKIHYKKKPKKTINPYNNIILRLCKRNFFLTVTNKRNQVKKIYTMGTTKFPEHILRSRLFIYKLGWDMGKILKALPVRRAKLKIKGWRRGTRRLIRAFTKQGLRWKDVTITAALPHNGCRGRKPKRR